MKFNIVKDIKAGQNRSMEPFRLPSDEEISAAYDQGKEAVMALFHQTLGKLAERIQGLEDQVAKNSENSRWVEEEAEEPEAEKWQEKRWAVRSYWAYPQGGSHAGSRTSTSGETLRSLSSEPGRSGRARL
jgi:hypothetical protein